MSKIDFRLLVEELLNESTIQLFLPIGVTRADEVLASIQTFTENLHSGGQKYLSKDYLVSNKPYWPYADVLEYITVEASRALPRFASDFKSQLSEVITALRGLNVKSSQVGFELIKILKKNKTSNEQEVLREVDASQKISEKVEILEKNKTNYRSYSNPRLAQANDETSVLAAEPYLGKTPKDAVVSVLKDFGGYDQTLAENIIKYPAEPKYTQRSENIDNMVMKSIIDISKLTLIFYREKIQIFGPQILDLLNYSDFKDSISRSFMVSTEQINAALKRAGTEEKNQSLITNVLNKITSIIGLETPVSPSDTLEKIFHDDYIHFIEGKSSLVLKEEAYTSSDILSSKNLTQYSLIKRIQDFDTHPGKGHSIYESYLYLFNNIKKGELPTKWQKRAETAGKFLDATATAAQGAASLARGFKGF
jgi:hypothetical protein